MIIFFNSIVGTTSYAQELKVGDSFLLNIKHSTNNLMINNQIFYSKDKDFPNIENYTVKIDSSKKDTLPGMVTEGILFTLTANSSTTSYSLFSHTDSLINYLLYAILPITDFWTMYETLTINEKDLSPFLINYGYPLFINSSEMNSIMEDKNFRDYTSISSEGLIFNFSHMQSTNFSVYRTLDRKIFFEIPSNKSFVSNFEFFYNETLFFQNGNKSRIFYLHFSFENDPNSSTYAFPRATTGFTTGLLVYSILILSIVVYRKKSKDKKSS